jgi:uncharacterized protein YdeI (YjbR/CyaY-like superfamily)
MKKDPRIDAYIKKAAPFAQPVLKHLRTLIHATCPEIEENIKWGMPSFEYQGNVCGFAAFKAHCTFGFWKQSLLKDPKGLLEPTSDNSAMGNMGRITSLKDLPSDKVLAGFIRQAVALNAQGIKVTKPKVTTKVLPEPHPEFVKALQADKKALTTYTAFPPGQKREYLEWINEAKTKTTRDKRIETAIIWLGEGKKRNWKYENC